MDGWLEVNSVLILIIFIYLAVLKESLYAGLCLSKLSYLLCKIKGSAHIFFAKAKALNSNL
jgi:hypothetical protein